jgi:two-component system sensor histidine kinase/response regulator
MTAPIRQGKRRPDASSRRLTRFDVPGYQAVSADGNSGAPNPTMSIARRLALLLAVPLLALVGIGVFMRFQLDQVEDRTRFVSKSRIAALVTLGNLSRSFTEMRVDVRGFLLATGPAQREVARRHFDANEAEVIRLLHEYEDHLVYSAEGRQLLGEFKSLSRDWITEARSVMTLLEEGKREEAMGRLNEGIAMGDRLAAVSRQWIANNEDLATTAGSGALQAIDVFRANMILAIVGAVLIAGVLGYVTLQRIIRPIRALEKSVRTIAAGDYEKDVPFTQATDETGGLARSIDQLKQAAGRTQALLTQTKQQEAELAFRLTFQEALLTTIPYPMFFKDASGRFLGCNRAYEHEFGTTSDFLTGKTVLDLDYLPEADRRKFHDEDMAVIASAGRRSYELPITYADGQTHTTLYSVDGFKLSDGTPGGLIGLLVDISDQKQAAEALSAARQRAEDATQMKSMFLANMSHEIRTPMNAIIGLSYLALKTPLNAKQRDYVGKVHNAGTSLLAVINDILDFSKIEAGRLDLESTSFRLDDVLASVTTLTAQKAHEKGLEFLARVGPDIAEHLRGDPLRLGQVLTNLVNNSVKFTEHGEIQLTAELMERTGDRCQIKFAVRDTGMGMTREQSERLFQPFVQADMSTTRKHGGTGLGLTICRRLVELMGGQIWLESAPGEGSTFTFTVWLGIGDQPGVRRVIPEKLTKIRALIVDDNSAAREIIDDLVDDIVFHADSVGSGPEAISAVRQNDADAPYDVIFMDWRMPGMDGLQAARAIKADAMLKHPPAVIMVTAFGREEVRDEAERLGLDGFLVKPVTKSMVVDALINVFVDATEQAAAAATAKSEGVRLDGLRVLLAEDNEINQQIAVELLEGVGASVTVANHGRAAVERLTNGPTPPPFDIVLMDLQMPEMDGHQATALLRADPRFASLPILAMTAHATAEEREACLARGMSGHLSKPIEPKVLFETLARWRKAGASSLRATDSAPGKAALPVIPGLDAHAGLARVGGNEKLYLKLLRQFTEQQGDTAAQIFAALQRSDAATAESLAHSLRGVAGNLGAQAVQNAAGQLEKMAHERSPAEALDGALAGLNAALNPLLVQLKATLAAPAATTRAPFAPTADDLAQTKTRAAELSKLLEGFDASATAFAQAHRDQLRVAFDALEWTQFKQYLENFAFAEAHALLEQARGRLPA